MSKFTGFTLDNFKTLFADSRLILIVVQTFFLAFLSSLIATVIGTIGALNLVKFKRRRRETLLGLNNVLMVSPDVVIGASFLILFTIVGMKLGFMSVLLSHIAFSIPIVVLMVMPLYQEMDSSLIDAANDLGANSSQIMREITLPYLTPGISLEINALSTLVFLFSILLVIGYYYIMRDSETVGKSSNLT